MRTLAVLFLFATSVYANDVTVGLTGQEGYAQVGSLGPVNQVPEPGSLWLLAVAGVALRASRGCKRG